MRRFSRRAHLQRHRPSRRNPRAPASLLISAILSLTTAAVQAAQLTTTTTRTLTTTVPTTSLTLRATAKPDLAIKSIAADASCHIVVIAVNNGPGSVPDSVWTTKTPASSSVYLTINGTGWGGATIWSFDAARHLQTAGGSATYTSSYTVKGSVTVQATVDRTAQVAETNEGNNSSTATLTCGKVSVLPGALNLKLSGAGGTTDNSADESQATDNSYYDTTPMPSGVVPSSGGTSLLGAPLPPPPQSPPPAPSNDSPTLEPGELVVASANLAEAQQLAASAQALGLSVKRRSNVAGLGLVITVLRVPKGMGVGDALLNLRQAVPNVWADANHRFELMGADAKTYGERVIGWHASPACGIGLRLGLVDTAIEKTHPQFRGRKIHSRAFLPAGIPAAAPDHGTAVAALLVGEHIGLVPAAQLYVASIFRTRGKQLDTTAEWLVRALGWLAENHVSVINLSLGGPRNLLVEAAVQRLQERGIAVVAAAGNGGSDSPPVYPAAQPGVVAVTAVDADLKPYRHANHGDYISFAAPGVDVWTATPGTGGAYVSGTSYAVPFVTASLATAHTSPRTSWATVIARLESKARDLGRAGKDPVFGWGLIQMPGCRARR
jgi:Subtilase family/CARDB